jgi:hypothetical protein
MTIISTLEDYLSGIEIVSSIDNNLMGLKWELTQDRYAWEAFNPKDTKLQILALEKERKIAVAYAVESLKSQLLNNYSADYYVFSIANGLIKKLEIHRTNCICTAKLVDGNFDFCSTFEDAQNKAYEICQLIHWDFTSNCEKCLPYWDIVALKLEVENFFKSI